MKVFVLSALAGTILIAALSFYHGELFEGVAVSKLFTLSADSNISTVSDGDDGMENFDAFGTAGFARPNVPAINIKELSVEVSELAREAYYFQCSSGSYCSFASFNDFYRSLSS